MTLTKKIDYCEIISGLTPSGLGRLVAVLGGNTGDNPYSPGTVRFAAWQKGFYDVIKLQSVDFLAHRDHSRDGHALNA